jgi:hypothetical protein
VRRGKAERGDLLGLVGRGSVDAIAVAVAPATSNEPSDTGEESEDTQTSYHAEMTLPHGAL